MSWFKKDPLQIIAFQSYGTDTHFYLRGRALQDETIDLEQRGFFKLLINTWKRIESDEVKHVVINIKLPNGKVLKTKSDSHGYFKVEATLDGLTAFANERGWLTCEVSYNNVNTKRSIQKSNRFPAEILIPSTKAAFGVASDIDDTILHTGVVSTLKWRVLYNSVFKSAKMRLPLEGAADFYHLLHRGKTGKNVNPIFYVSHSPWNMYRYLELFLKQNNFPKGPILLRSFKQFLKKKAIDEKPQKQKEILNLLKTYPDLPFILIGDSGEHDIDIYIEIAEQFPERIKAIYLRSVKHKKKVIRVKRLLEHYNTTPALLVESSEQAILHARENGFIV
ncbi:phosphatase domain-containing protein [Lacinutrix sp.]|uniref:App1 family protein n=1 Tax=Lacinutrix sp. TaxID=1937692 RepID=UPI0025C31392|nr:phosphatase domain-containing protein [Lacinutrix sp.]